MCLKCILQCLSVKVSFYYSLSPSLSLTPPTSPPSVSVLLKLYLLQSYCYFPFRYPHDQSVSQEEFINSGQVLSNKVGHVQDTIITVAGNN